MPIILGIDPGSRITGFGIIEAERDKRRYIACGCIRSNHDDLSLRLHEIHAGMQKVYDTYRPTTAAIEQVFMHNNANAALKLGQARGAAIVAIKDLQLAEYSPRQIKQSVVGFGAADKTQVQHMVRFILQLTKAPKADAADALAVALTHANTLQSQQRIKDI